MAPLSTSKVSTFEQHKSWGGVGGVDLRAILLCVDMKGLQNLLRVGRYIGVCIEYDYLTFACL